VRLLQKHSAKFSLPVGLGFLAAVGVMLSANFVQATQAVIFNSQGWVNSREIVTPGGQRDDQLDDFVLVELDGGVYESAQEDLRDLRVVDSQGIEVASKVVRLSHENGERELAVTVINQALTADGRATLTLDLGADPPRHNSVRLRTESRNFSQRVSVEAGDDNRRWELLRDDGYIFDFSRDTHAHSLKVDYPLSTRRYLRVSVEGRDDGPVRIDGADVFFLTELAAKLNHLPARLLSQEQDGKQRASVLLLDLNYAKLPTARVEFETDAENFQRRVEIEGSNSAESLKPGGEYLWRPVGGGEIFDIRLDRRRPRQLRVDYSEARFRYLRVKIFNYDDRPIKISAVKVSGHPRYLLFRREAGHSYRLFYGNPLAAPPRYDIEQLAAYLNLEKLPVARLGDERRLEPAARAEESRPPRGPLWLWAALVAAAAVLGTLIYRLARAAGAPQNNDARD
jgi:hypothetical protein